MGIGEAFPASTGGRPSSLLEGSPFEGSPNARPADLYAHPISPLPWSGYIGYGSRDELIIHFDYTGTSLKTRMSRDVGTLQQDV